LLQAKFDAKRVCRLMHRRRPTVAPMVPMMFHALNAEMVRSGRTITGLRACLSGAAPLPSRVREEFERLTGSAILEGYGLSEASPVTHSNPLSSRARSGSIGLPLPSTLARIVDVESGRSELPTGEVGELVVQGPQVMTGYLDDPAETAIALRDGWLHTGDLARVDADGYFTLVDRKKDLIITGGLKVYPNEVETVLLSHPQIQECAVVGVPDDRYGEAVTAYVVARLRGRLDCEQLREFCRRQLASYKVPRKIHPCDVLPTTFLGKVRRVDLRNRAA
jgi:long-chain acyl-CoA synthetase